MKNIFTNSTSVYLLFLAGPSSYFYLVQEQELRGGLAAGGLAAGGLAAGGLAAGGLAGGLAAGTGFRTLLTLLTLYRLVVLRTG